MKPVIVMNADVNGEWSRLRLQYPAAVRAADGNPLVAPAGLDPKEDMACIQGLMRAADGILLTGGDDYDPTRWGGERHVRSTYVDPRREAFDVAFAAAAVESGLPVLAICAGCQLLSIAAGGQVIQHIGDPGKVSPHAGGSRHGCRIETGSLLARALGADRLEVNSHHHQAVHQSHAGDGFCVVAHAEPPMKSPEAGSTPSTERFAGCVEGIESSSGAPVLGVQWHPERIMGEPAGFPLFAWLVSEARRS